MRAGGGGNAANVRYRRRKPVVEGEPPKVWIPPDSADRRRRCEWRLREQ
jgi:hypothetical protein